MNLVLQYILKKIYKPSIPIIKLNGLITETSTELVEASLQQINKISAQALTLIINSQGGSFVQSDIIIRKIKLFCLQNNIPLLTFSQEKSCSAGYYILSQGDQVFADSLSQIGNISSQISWNQLQFKDNKFHLEFDGVQSYEKFDGSGVFQNHRSNNQKQIFQNIKEKMNQTYLSEIIEARQNKLQLDEIQLKSKIPRIFLGEQAVKLGLVDEIGSYQRVLFKYYPDAYLDFISDQVSNQIVSKKKRNQFKNYMSKR